jgi:hypothetical protein
LEIPYYYFLQKYIKNIKKQNKFYIILLKIFFKILHFKRK